MPKSVEFFLNTKELKIQLDILRNNRQLLIQVYKQKDIINWKNTFSITDLEGCVLLIHFHKSKTNNSENFIRFKSCELYNDFVSVDFFGRDFFFLGIKSTCDLKQFNFLISRILKDIYSLNQFDLNGVHFEVVQAR